jgi:hypothetical protein
MRIHYLPLVGLLLLACTEETTRPPVEEVPPLEAGSVRATVVAEPGPITVTKIRIDANSLELGAYQGRFTFDPEALELVEVVMPEGDYRFVNTNEASEGVIRFAGFTVTEFESPVALELRFKRVRDLDLNDLSVDLEVVGDVVGAEVKGERILEPALLIAR